MIERLCGVHAVLVKKAVHLLYRVDLFGCESAAVESYGVDAAERDRFARDDSERRYVLVDLRASLYHTMSADMSELVHEGAAADDGEVIYFHLAGELSGIGHDDVIMQDTVVRYVAVCHDEVVIADYGLTFAGCTAVDSHELTEHAVIADDGPGLFAAELEILRHTTDDGVREHMAVIAEDDIVVDVCESVYGDVLADLRFRTYIC